ncbi:MAG: NAD(P)/FAD-dependent oxidoreductase [Gammaproteobacteria bacterium]|nr:NAD(P)/FAD-dependent oxidoreductase [Gammaproteobacteria bacterium]MBU0848298.1 NAD(P)/FAD-dependent oxidoreductase [Gammaproteobacteria bacterium]MBU1266991.1 NAD(P)/FAD-dependent oxidoreductase [Gammaproteobacteria bacterium]MBU1529568.1 NAD(P)/FAD-dependent oxidoreductase [Gammaproteobacteria bacterium]MBU1781149.1 NAD(P)/FAD-dependent oxidoreductase [Gammaproteobacteria bacterium]
MQRRQFLQTSALATALLGGMPLSATAKTAKGKVVVIGGGYGGATAAKYLRLLSGNQLNVTLVEPNATFISCPMSNLVVGGLRKISEISTPYTGLARNHGVKMVKDYVTAIDVEKRTVKLKSGKTLPYDKLVLSPGIDLQLDKIEGLAAANANGQILQAWKAGPETVGLRKQLEAMPDGGTYILNVPLAPYRCPPGPYERASMVANYFKQYKPKSKVLLLDANADVTSKGKLFKGVWESEYKGILEYRPNMKVTGVDGATKTVRFEFEEPIKGDVLNILPEQRAGKLVVDSGIANLNKRWAEVNYMTFESTVAPNVHVIGDSVQSAPLMPKSGHMANSQAKVVAAAIVAQLSGWEPNATPLTNNTCYSYVTTNNVIHVASVHVYNAEKKTFLTVEGSGGVSAAPNELEGTYAWNWAQNIWADTLV